MPIPSKRKMVPAALLLGAAGTVFFLTIGSLDPRSTLQANLQPWPDAAEYLDGALHWVQEGSFRIHVAARVFPSRYPFGFSLATAGLLEAGVPPLDAPFLLNKWAGLLLLLSVFAALAWRGHFGAAGLAALILSTRTSFILLSRSPMSEAASLLPIFWGAVLLYRYAARDRRWMGPLGALLLGFSLCFRLSSCLLLGFVAAALAARCGRKRRLWLSEGWRSALGYAAGASPLLIYNWLTFGAPWKTGYGYWLGSGGDPLRMFGQRYLGRNLWALWQEVTQNETTYTVAHLFGDGSYLAPAYALLCLLSLWMLRKHRRTLVFAAVCAAYSIVIMFYKFGEARQLYPLLVLSVPLAALSWMHLWNSSIAARRWGRAAAAALLLPAVLVGWPGSGSQSDMGAMFRTHSLQRNAFAYEAVRKLNSLSAARKLVLSEMVPPYIHALSGEGTWAAPLQEDHAYRFVPQHLTFSAPQRRALVEEALASGREVYAACAYFPLEKLEEASPAPPGKRWNVLWRNQVGGGVAQLAEASPQ